MKFVRMAFYEVATPSGAPAPSGVRSHLKRHKFNFVRYGPTGDWFMEPVNESTVLDDDTASPVGEGVEDVYYEGFEILNQVPETGFDDPRGA